MKRLSVLALGLVALSASLTQAQNLLVNPGLDDPPVHEGTTATGWTLDTFRTFTGPADTANFADFADREAPAGRGLWYRAFIGTPENPAQADLYQDVPGTPGMKYILNGWAHFEQFYAGGVDNLGAMGEGLPSPTDTVFALEFLGPADIVLPGSTSIELRANGQTNDQNPADPREWTEHMLMAVAPPGTLEVRVRASMVNGVANQANPQSAFVDDFSLICIPEPASVALGLLGVLGLLGLVRRR
jgi:hypothetical protein